MVRHVVAEIRVGRRVDRGEPDGVHPETGEVVQAGDQPREVSQPVPVGVRERAGIFWSVTRRRRLALSRSAPVPGEADTAPKPPAASAGTTTASARMAPRGGADRAAHLAKPVFDRAVPAGFGPFAGRAHRRRGGAAPRAPDPQLRPVHLLLGALPEVLPLPPAAWPIAGTPERRWPRYGRFRWQPAGIRMRRTTPSARWWRDSFRAHPELEIVDLALNPAELLHCLDARWGRRP